MTDEKTYLIEFRIIEGIRKLNSFNKTEFISDKSIEHWPHWSVLNTDKNIAIEEIVAKLKCYKDDSE